ncbi:zinc finger protein DHHC domain containing protein [Ceratocystis lukuohia]|uniref:Zinc finger protein DHHC domain containing protein n=1 Tax=Ceratocystis lukuohia TaxID=2019550 RepID=A0ABR4ML00_9PEZI
MDDRGHFYQPSPLQHQQSQQSQQQQQQQQQHQQQHQHQHQHQRSASSAFTNHEMSYATKADYSDYIDEPAFVTATPRTTHSHAHVGGGGSDSTMTSPHLSSQAAYVGSAPHRFAPGQKSSVSSSVNSTTSPPPDRGYRSPSTHATLPGRGRSKSPSPNGKISYVMSDSNRMYGVGSGSTKRSKSHVRGHSYASPNRDYDHHHPDDFLDSPTSPRADYPHQMNTGVSVGGRFNGGDRFDISGRMRFGSGPTDASESDYQCSTNSVDAYDVSTRSERDPQHQRPVLMYDQGRANLNVTTTTTGDARRVPLMGSTRPGPLPTYETSPKANQLVMQTSPRASTSNTSSVYQAMRYPYDMTEAEKRRAEDEERQRLAKRFALKNDTNRDKRILQLEYRDDTSSKRGFNLHPLDTEFDGDYRDRSALMQSQSRDTRDDADRDRRARGGITSNSGYRSEDDVRVRKGGRDVMMLKDKSQRERSRMAEDRRYKSSQNMTPDDSDFEDRQDDTLGGEDYALVNVISPDRSAIRDERDVRDGARKRTKNESPTKRSARSRTRERDDGWGRQEEEKEKRLRAERERELERERERESREIEREAKAEKEKQRQRDASVAASSRLPPTPPKEPQIKSSIRSSSTSPTTRTKKFGAAGDESRDASEHAELRDKRPELQSASGITTPDSSITPASSSPRPAGSPPLDKSAAAFESASAASEGDEEDTPRGRTKPTDVPEKKQVRVVSPKREKSQGPKKLKGILKQPSKFPENNDINELSNAAADSSDDRWDRNKELVETGNPIPEGARWTRLARRIVNREALDMENEKYDVMDDQIIVMRVLSHAEIQAYADATAELRASKSSESLNPQSAPALDNNNNPTNHIMYFYLERAERRRKHTTHRDDGPESSRRSTRSRNDRNERRRDESAEHDRRRDKRRERGERDPYRGERDRY